MNIFYPSSKYKCCSHDSRSVNSIYSWKRNAYQNLIKHVHKNLLQLQCEQYLYLEDEYLINLIKHVRKNFR